MASLFLLFSFRDKPAFFLFLSLVPSYFVSESVAMGNSCLLAASPSASLSSQLLRRSVSLSISPSLFLPYLILVLSVFPLSVPRLSCVRVQ